MVTSVESSATICVRGIRGGHGATTIAGAMAAVLGWPATSHDPEAFRWLWASVHQPWSTVGPRVVDAGVVNSSLHDSGTKVAVLRGPCTLGLLTLFHRAGTFDHLIVIREPWRSIRQRDVESALSTNIAAEVAHSPRVARLADAGLLAGRVGDLDEFAELKNWATARWPDPTA